MIRSTITALLLSVVFVLALGTRLTWLASHHLSDAQHAVEQKQFALAFDYYNRAIRNYYPGNPYSRKAVLNAKNFVGSYSQNINKDLQQFRGSLLSIRSLYQPYNKEVEWIENKLSESRE
ncbi:MAG: hypothetical protein P9L94_10935 [Candidatus Hinthialibacter antarcticus]|nr:hypothetical protein [Candidatus Hinthialibacter antarcticus]